MELHIENEAKRRDVTFGSSIAIFGNKGYLGSQLECAFRAKKMAVQGFDLPEYDISSEAHWVGFEPTRYSAILFFAGLTGTEKSFENAGSFLDVNERGLLNLLRKLAPLGAQAPKILFPSTRLVYKGREAALKEDDPKEAKTVYAANKLACEHLLEAYHARYGIPYVVTRICVPYGSLSGNDYSYGTIGFFLRQAEAGGPITLYGNGSIRRTFTHVADICAAVTFLAESKTEGVFNIGGTTASLGEVAGLIARRKGVPVQNIPWPDVAARLESGSTFFDSTKLDALQDGRGYQDIRNLVGSL